MKLRRGWRRSAVKPSDRLESALKSAVRASGLAGEMLAYHFGYNEGEPVRRGKRLRPRLLIAVAQECGAGADRALDAAVAVELLHNYSLIHDDIEDGDRLRHGRETLWAKFGMPQAVNAGDALSALSFLALLRAGERHDAARVNELVGVLHAAQLEMCLGQSLDMQFETQGGVALEAYLEMVAGKTAALFAASCALGAMCAEAPAKAVEQYRALGAAFGMAFQIYDDVLGIWADTAATGKTRGADIARRKKSFPVVWALQGPPGEARDVVAKAYGDRSEIGDRQLEAVIGALDLLGAREAALSAAANHLAVVERSRPGAVRDFLLSLLPVASAEETVRS